MTSTAFSIITTAAAGTVLAALGAVDGSNGNNFLNTGREAIEISNGSGSGINVTFVTQGVYSVGSTNYPIADLVVGITNGQSKVVGPFDKTLFNDADGLVQLSFSSGTTVTARVISLGAA